MKLHTLSSTKNSRHENRIVGRGIGSGMGKTSTRGHKGQGARKSGNVRIGFEGGQTPLLRRIPKRGFSNDYHQLNYLIVNLDSLNSVNGVSEIDLDVLHNQNILKVSYSKKPLLKVLGDGNIDKPLTIRAHKFSKSAIEKIEKAGGKAIILEHSSVPKIETSK